MSGLRYCVTWGKTHRARVRHGGQVCVPSPARTLSQTVVSNCENPPVTAKRITTEIGRIFIGILLLIFLVGWVVTIDNRIWDLRMQGIEMNFVRTTKLIFYGFLFIRPVMAILALTGLFIKNVVGWILMNGLFYFLIFDLIFVGIPKMNNGLVDYLGILFLLVPIVIANTPLVRRQFNVCRNWIVNANLASICLGIVTAFIQGYYVVNSEMGIWEIIEKIN